MSKKRTRTKGQRPQQHKKASAGTNYARQARRLIKNEQFGRAIQMLRQAVGLEPNNANWQMMLGRLLIRQRRNPEGIDHLVKALQVEPDLVPALIELGQAYSADNRLEDGRKQAEKGIRLAPDDPAANLVYGSILQKLGELPKAVEHFRKSLEIRLVAPDQVQEAKLKDDFDDPETEALLWQTLSQLARANVHAFAASGTLLGLVREGGLLPFDKDIDLGVPNSELSRARRCLENNGWINLDMPFNNPLSFAHPVRKVTLDLMGFVVDPDTSYTYVGIWQDGIPYEWCRQMYLSTLSLNKSETPTGDPIWKMSDPETYLEQVYGDWRTPDPYFDTIICAKNLCGFPYMTQAYAFSRIYSHWKNGKLRKALNIVRHTRRHLPEDDLMQRVEAHLDSLLPADDEPLTPTHADSEEHSPTASQVTFDTSISLNILGANQ